MRNKSVYISPDAKVICVDSEEIICSSRYSLRYPSSDDKPATHLPTWNDESYDRYRSGGSQIWD